MCVGMLECSFIAKVLGGGGGECEMKLACDKDRLLSMWVTRFPLSYCRGAEGYRGLQSGAQFGRQCMQEGRSS